MLDSDRELARNYHFFFGGRRDQINASDDELIALDEALERLARENATCAQLVQLRFFTGRTLAA